MNGSKHASYYLYPESSSLCRLQSFPIIHATTTGRYICTIIQRHTRSTEVKKIRETMFASRNFFQFAARKTVVRQRLFHASPQALAKLNVEGLAQKVNLEGQNVLVRADLNVPLDKVRRAKQAANLDTDLFAFIFGLAFFFRSAPKNCLVGVGSSCLRFLTSIILNPFLLSLE